MIYFYIYYWSKCRIGDRIDILIDLYFIKGGVK
uniref:Uncharacterized protein n=1 Tax=Arundo donax TaxID=35708 RepID=A0A0A9BG62_ARUDO